MNDIKNLIKSIKENDTVKSNKILKKVIFNKIQDKINKINK